MPLSRRDADLLRPRLDALRKTYDVAFLDTDPLGMVHLYNRDEDREVAALFSAMLAFGNAVAIRASIARILGLWGERPANRLKLLAPADAARCRPLYHRWVDGEALWAFSRATGAALRAAGSLERFFLGGYDPAAPTLTGALTDFRRRLLALAEESGLTPNARRGLGYLLPDPAGPSACKRWHLFLRWVVRPRDGLDLGLWKAPRTDQLLIPLDTHIARIGGLLGLTDRRTADRRMAEEITASLRLFDPSDPVRYDFALSRLGILKHCPRRRDDRLCAGCPLQDACRHWRGVHWRRKRAARAALPASP